MYRIHAEPAVPGGCTCTLYPCLYKKGTKFVLIASMKTHVVLNPVASHMDEAQPTAVLDPCLPDPYTLYKTESYDTVRVMIHKALDVR